MKINQYQTVTKHLITFQLRHPQNSLLGFFALCELTNIFISLQRHLFQLSTMEVGEDAKEGTPLNLDNFAQEPL